MVNILLKLLRRIIVHINIISIIICWSLLLFLLDETKIGQKLLEKMGWSKGKGLGREEQGDLEPVRLKYKNDAEGVGYEAKDDLWVAHREEFNNILGSLNGNHVAIDTSEPIPVKSLEVRSKSSKARVHYHKFTRGKDLSRYSASDMACILGKRADVIKQEPEEEEKSDDSSSNVEHLHGVTTIHRGSIQEYFATKMAAVKEKQNLTERETQLPSDGETNVDDREKEKRVRINEELNVVKQFFAKEKILKKNSQNAKESMIDETTEDTQKKKKTKTKIKEESVTMEVLPVNDEHIAGSKKKKKTKDISAEPTITTEEPMKTKKSKKRKTEEVASEVVEYEEEHTEPERKKKKKKNEIEEETNPGEVLLMACEEVTDINITKKKKKKSKKEEVEVSDNKLTNGSAESIVNQERKKSKKKILETPSEHTVQNGDEDNLQSKKKKKKSKKDVEPEPDYIEEIESENKKKTRKTNEVVVEQTQNGFVEKSKKKKKTIKQEEEIVPEKYTKLENSFVESDSIKHKTSKSEKTEDIDHQKVAESDVQQPKKKKKKSKKVEEETPEKFSDGDTKQINQFETKESSNLKIKKELDSEPVICKTDDVKNENIKTNQISSDSKKLAIVQENESRQRQKVIKLLEKADFDKFVGKRIVLSVHYWFNMV